MDANTPKITLVGAGPGSPDLLTIKGAKALKKAKVILYDALVSEELFKLAPKAKKIFVGKRLGYKAFEQDEINKLLVSEALTHGNVVRLKGGDSFVFGRGYEELVFAQHFGIKTEVVPGISSSISVPALAGIPVTHRGASNGFFVLTATLADGSLNPELYLAAQSQSTVVVLMGLNKLKQITQLFMEKGKNEVAAAVISNGSLPNQRQVIGTVETLVELVKTEKIPAPAVIVIGDVVSLQNKNNQLANNSFFSCN